MTALVRSLPKALRVNFVPVPEHAARALAMLDPDRGSLYRQLATALAAPVACTCRGRLPRGTAAIQLRMNFVVVDDRARSRSLARPAALQLRRGPMRGAISAAAQAAWLHSGCRSWSFGDLPDTFDGLHDGQRLFGYVALVDEGTSVGVRVFATIHEAQGSHPRGLTRLIRLQLAKDLKPLLKDLAVTVQGELAYPKLREELLDRVVAAVFIEGRPLPRTAAGVEARIAQCRGGIGLPAQEISRCVQQTLDAWVAAQARLKACPLPATKADVTAQLARLLPAGFVADTPWVRLREFPRYLKAVLHRLEKAPQDPARDLKLSREVEAVETRYWQAVIREKGSRPASEDPFRWLLEEYRVSLFAQQLKTPVPVSAKRLTEAWQERVNA